MTTVYSWTFAAYNPETGDGVSVLDPTDPENEGGVGKVSIGTFDQSSELYASRKEATLALCERVRAWHKSQMDDDDDDSDNDGCTAEEKELLDAGNPFKAIGVFSEENDDIPWVFNLSVNEHKMPKSPEKRPRADAVVADTDAGPEQKKAKTTGTKQEGKVDK